MEWFKFVALLKNDFFFYYKTLLSFRCHFVVSLNTEFGFTCSTIYDFPIDIKLMRIGFLLFLQVVTTTMCQ